MCFKFLSDRRHQSINSQIYIDTRYLIPICICSYVDSDHRPGWQLAALRSLRLILLHAGLVAFSSYGSPANTYNGWCSAVCVLCSWVTRLFRRRHCSRSQRRERRCLSPKSDIIWKKFIFVVYKQFFFVFAWAHSRLEGSSSNSNHGRITVSISVMSSRGACWGRRWFRTLWFRKSR